MHLTLDKPTTTNHEPINPCRHCKAQPTYEQSQSSATISCRNPECTEQWFKVVRFWEWADKDEAIRFVISTWNQASGTVTPEILNDLKDQWQADPFWDIENTGGFEQYRDELLAYRLEKEKQWEDERLAKRLSHAKSLGLSVNSPLFAYIEKLEYRIEQLEDKVSNNF